MPNHVTNIITIGGTDEQVKVVINFMKADDGQSDFDFNQLIPRAKSLDITAGTNLSEEEKQAEQINVQMYGAKNWYDWSIQNWGTKWNAYSCHIEGNIISFDTAWSHPFPVIEALCQKFPEITFSVEYADEDTGGNVGTYTQRGSEEIEVNQPKEYSKEAYLLAFSIGDNIDWLIESMSSDEYGELADREESLKKGEDYEVAIMEYLIDEEIIDAEFSKYMIEWSIEHCVKVEKYKYAETLKGILTEKAV